MNLDWTTELMQLNALGYIMNENLINDVTQKIEAAMGIKIL